MHPGKVTSKLSQFLTIAKSTFQFSFICTGTTMLTYIETEKSSLRAKCHTEMHWNKLIIWW